jgi:hypothetical protein
MSNKPETEEIMIKQIAIVFWVVMAFAAISLLGVACQMAKKAFLFGWRMMQ